MTSTNTKKDERKIVDEKRVTPNIKRTEFDNGDVVFTAKVITKAGRAHREEFLSPDGLDMEDLFLTQAKKYVDENNHDPLVSKIDIVKSMKGSGFRVETEIGKYHVDEVFLKEDYEGNKPLLKAKESAEQLARIIKNYGQFYEMILQVKDANKPPNTDRTYSSPHSEYNLNFIPGAGGDEASGHFNVKAKVRKRLKGDLITIGKIVSVSRFNGDVSEAKNVAKEIRRFWINESIRLLTDQLVTVLKGGNPVDKIKKQNGERKKLKRKVFEMEARLEFLDLEEEE